MNMNMICDHVHVAAPPHQDPYSLLIHMDVEWSGQAGVLKVVHRSVPLLTVQHIDDAACAPRSRARWWIISLQSFELQETERDFGGSGNGRSFTLEQLEQVNEERPPCSPERDERPQTESHWSSCAGDCLLVDNVTRQTMADRTVRKNTTYIVYVDLKLTRGRCDVLFFPLCSNPIVNIPTPTRKFCFHCRLFFCLSAGLLKKKKTTEPGSGINYDEEEPTRFNRRPR